MGCLPARDGVLPCVMHAAAVVDSGFVQAGNGRGCAGWGEPSSSLKPQQAVPPALKPMLHECYAMFDLLLPYALKPEPLPSSKAATGALADRLSASALNSPRLRPSLDDADAGRSARHE